MSIIQGEAAKCAETVAAGDGEALANGALWVYSIAFDEFRRALATESRDRAELLAAMWDHCFALVQVLHCSLKSIRYLGQYRRELGTEQPTRLCQHECCEGIFHCTAGKDNTGI